MKARIAVGAVINTAHLFFSSHSPERTRFRGPWAALRYITVVGGRRSESGLIDDVRCGR